MTLDVKAYRDEQSRITERQMIEYEGYTERPDIRAQLNCSYMLRVCQPKPKVLEIGCKTGYVLLNVPTHCSEDPNKGEYDFFDPDKFYGIDICEKALAIANHKGLHVALCDMHNLCFEDAFFDMILANEVLEHSHSPEVAMDEMVRVLKPGGHLILDVPCQMEDTYEGIENDAGHLQFYPEQFDFYNMFRKHFIILDKYFVPAISHLVGMLVLCAYGGLFRKREKPLNQE